MNIEILDKDDLRDLMLREKDFLAKLFQSNSVLFTKKQIVNSESRHLTLLINVLHYIANGSIPLRKKDYASVCKSKKHGFIFKSFRTIENVKKLLNESRENQTKALTKISMCYPNLFFALFHEF